MADKKITPGEIFRTLGLAAMGETEPLTDLLGNIQAATKRQLKDGVERDRALRDGADVEAQGEPVDE